MNLRKLCLQLRALISFSAALSLGGFLHGAPVNSVVIVRATPNPVVQGQNATIIAGVNVNASVEATGTITINDICQTASGPVSTTLGSFTLGSATSPNPGSGSLVVSNFPCLGANQIVASYPGDAVYAPGTSAPLILTVLSQFTATTVSLTSSGNPVTVGQSVTFTSQLTYSITNNTFPTGTVTFTDTSTNTVLGTATVTTAGGPRGTTTFATLSVSLPAGTYAVQAAYSGNNIYAASTSQILSQVVQGTNVNPTTTALTASASTINAGQPVSLTVQVSSPNGVPAGTVSFYDGTTLLAALALNATGQATLSTSSLAPGSHSITAAYGGSSKFANSTSGAVTVTVQPASLAPTTTALNSSKNPAGQGDSITLSATVTSSSSGTPTGTVSFANGASVLGTANLQNGVATLNMSFSAGTYQLSATYSGDNNFSPSTGTLSQVVNPPALLPTATAISSSTNPSTYGQPVSFTAVVTTGDSGTATGAITFTAGSITAVVNLDDTGTAVFTTSALPVGSTSVSAVYSGDGKYAGSASPILGQTVLPSATPVQLSLGGTAFVYDSTTGLYTSTLTVTNNGTNSVAGPVQMVFANLVPGIIVTNATGTYNGAPYITLPGSAIASGQSVSFPVQLSNPNSTWIAFRADFYSGVFQ